MATTKAALRAASEYSNLSAKLNALTSARDEALRTIAIQYDAEIERLKKDRDEAAELVIEYARANQANIFPAGKKTAKWEGLTISYRDGNPKVELLDETGSWDDVLVKALKFAPDYVATKQELAKSKIIADSPQLQKILPKLGIKIMGTVSWSIKAQ